MHDARPQEILTPITESAIFLTVGVDPGGEELAKELLPDLGGLRHSVGFRAPPARLRRRDRDPGGVEADAAVLVEDEDPAFAGGSYLIVQKYGHDLDAWNALTVEQQ